MSITTVIQTHSQMQNTGGLCCPGTNGFINFWGACGIMVFVVGNGHGDTSSNPGRD